MQLRLLGAFGENGVHGYLGKSACERHSGQRSASRTVRAEGGQEGTGEPESWSAGDLPSLVMLGLPSDHVSQEMSRSKIVLSARVRASDALFLKLTNRCRWAIR